MERGFAEIGSGSIGATTAPPKIPELSSLDNEMAALQDRANNLVCGLKALGDRLLGERPEKDGVDTPREVRSGLVGDLRNRAGSLDYLLGEAQRAADRLNQLG